MTSLGSIRNLVESADSLEEKIDRELHQLPVSDIESRAEAENEVIDTAKDVKLVSEDIESIEELMNELNHVQQDQIEELNELIDNVNEKSSEEHHRLVNLLKTIKKEKITKKWANENKRELKDDIEGINELTEELKKLTNIIKIIGREIGREGEYLMELSGDEVKALENMAINYSREGSESLSESYQSLSSVFRKEGENTFRLVKGEEELSEQVSGDIDKILKISSRVEEDIENLEQKIMPYTSEIYAQDVAEIHYVKKLLNESEDNLEYVRNELEEIKEDLNKDWGQIESKVEEIPADLKELDEISINEDIEEKIKPTPIQSYFQESDKIKNASILPKDYKYIERTLRNHVSDLEKVICFLDGEIKVLSGVDALKWYEKIRSNYENSIMTEIRLEKSDSLLSSKKETEIWMLVMDESGAVIHQYGFNIGDPGGFFADNDRALDESLLEWLEKKDDEGKLPAF